MKHQAQKKVSSERGVVLLVAVLISSVVLVVGMGIYQRTYKELYFSSFWKQTQAAATAADSGVECALYWAFHTTGGMATCFGNNLTWPPGYTTESGGNDMGTYSGCVKVTITWDGAATTTTARGYNDTCTVVDAGTNPRTVERGLKVGYFGF